MLDLFKCFIPNIHETIYQTCFFFFFKCHVFLVFFLILKQTKQKDRRPGQVLDASDFPEEHTVQPQLEPRVTWWFVAVPAKRSNKNVKS